MHLNELKRLIAVFEKSEVFELEIEEDGHRVLLEKESTQQIITQVAAAQPVASASPVTSAPNASVELDDSNYVTAPLVGTFYTAPNPQAKPYVEVGKFVKKGEVVCLVEAMKVMNEIKAPCDGTVKAILVDNGGMVEFNQRLIELGA